MKKVRCSHCGRHYETDKAGDIDLVGIKERYLAADTQFRRMMFNRLVTVAVALQGAVERKQHEKRLVLGKVVRLRHELAKVRAEQPEPNWSYSDISNGE